MVKFRVYGLALFFFSFVAGCTRTTSAGSFVASVKTGADGRVIVERCELRAKQFQIWLLFVFSDWTDLERGDCKKETLDTQLPASGAATKP